MYDLQRLSEVLGKEQSYKPKLLGVLMGVSCADSKPGEEFPYQHSFLVLPPPCSVRTEPSITHKPQSMAYNFCQNLGQNERETGKLLCFGVAVGLALFLVFMLVSGLELGLNRCFARLRTGSMGLWESMVQWFWYCPFSIALTSSVIQQVPSMAFT